MLGYLFRVIFRVIDCHHLMQPEVVVLNGDRSTQGLQFLLLSRALQAHVIVHGDDRTTFDPNGHHLGRGEGR